MQAESSAPTGRYRYTRASDQWWWSEGLYAIFGFAPGEVVPTAALMSHHQHPDDRARFARLLEQQLHGGRAFGCLNRLLDASGRQRWVTWIGEGTDTADGTSASGTVEGHAVDVTDQQERAVAEQANWHVGRALASREVIDQAKGVLMVVYQTSSDDAFGLLRWASQRGNVKLTVLAGQLLDAVRGGLDLGPTARQRVDDVISALLTTRNGRHAEDGTLDGATAALDGVRPAAERAPERHERLRTTLVLEGRTPVLRVSGEVDLATAPEFSSALNRLVSAGRVPGPVVVDLRDATHVGSVGVTMLIVANRRCEAASTPLRIVVAPGTASLSLVPGHGLALFPSPVAALGV
ncbi:anti-anti-sigma factor [Kineococcus xinjiangensis]|uniref:Anti-anti-sigma factor n=1 Tax=Kineococcus xinjiangensis TaxID=512762 RepID=A0A2S6IUQ4_9ACTN|nr:ANTAR domain-containing protein [Kineococcus xinjiangensis]PPK97966.1 anti-anti-sigma factor [Kineococcus xinjiangensis]